MAGVSLYSATKAALDAITISLSKELGAKNVRINSILPGATETEGARSAGVTTGSEAETMFVAKTPLGRRGQPEDIAKVAVFLASDDAAWVTGGKFPFRVVCMVFKFKNLKKMKDNGTKLLVDGGFINYALK